MQFGVLWYVCAMAMCQCVSVSSVCRQCVSVWQCVVSVSVCRQCVVSVYLAGATHAILEAVHCLDRNVL